uniref:Reverse transcriptase domain-containing protein n=1 Tax=Heterorhabditis bacteriophora TaxID=37862 RepID=A0A1I7X760_HETBA
MNYNPPASCPWKDLCRRWNEYGYLMTPATADGSEDGLEVEGLIKDAINAQWRKDYGIKVKDADRRGLLRDVHKRLKQKIEEYQKNIKDDGAQLNYKTKGNHRFENKYSTVPDQKNANNDLTRRCQLLDKNSENRKRLYTLKFLHNAFPGCIVGFKISSSITHCVTGLDIYQVVERYPHLAVRLSGIDPYQLNRKDLLLDDLCIPFNDECIIGSDYADIDWTLDGFNILPLKFKDPPSAIDVKCTTYGEPQNKSIMSEEEMCDLLLQM